MKLESFFRLSEPLDGLPAMAKAFLFDCDGTLIDTMPTHFQSWENALRERGSFGTLDWDAFMELGGMSGHEVGARLCAQTGLPDDNLDELVQRKRQLYHEALADCKAIPEVAEFARSVSRTHAVAVVSGGHAAAVHRSLEVTGLNELFEVVVTPEMVINGKPAPDMYLLAAERLGVDPADCIVFEDGLPGIEAARAAGMRVVVVEPPAALNPSP
jgi:beta-phosphoglucomutase family hydrolase